MQLTTEPYLQTLQDFYIEFLRFHYATRKDETDKRLFKRVIIFCFIGFYFSAFLVCVVFLS